MQKDLGWYAQDKVTVSVVSITTLYRQTNIVIFIGKQIIHTFIILVQDCNRQGNECDENAECVDTGVKKQIARGKVWKVHRCACKTGFVGNGITCADENTGNYLGLKLWNFIAQTLSR